MQPDPAIPPSHVPPTLAPPPLPTQPTGKPSGLRQLLAILLGVCLGFFLLDAAVSLLDDSIGMISGSHFFLGIRMVTSLFAVLLALVVYVLMAFTPAIPKRWFLPLTLFFPASQLLGIPLFIFYFAHLQPINWLFSALELLLGLWLLCAAQGGFKFGWPLVPVERLGLLRFTWRNFAGFVLANIFILLPAVVIFLFVSLGMAVNHFSDGFMTLHPRGFTVEVRKYVRADGKTIQLFPMSHVAESDFYQDISQTFPTNSIILMEGVTDEKNLLKNKISYQRMATALGLSEQHEKFEPTRGKMVRADIDVDRFTTNTLEVLKMVILIHTGGMDAVMLQRLMQFSTLPDFQEQLLDDLLRKRNQHLFEEIQSNLSETEHLIVPWGVAHMPGIARDIQQAGFQLEETRQYEVIRFHFPGTRKTPDKQPAVKPESATTNNRP